MDLQENIQNNPTIFGKILRGEIPADKVYEDDHILAFRDIQPKAKVHVLVIPKKHIKDLRVTSVEDTAILGHLMVKISEIAELAGLSAEGFRLIANNGEHSGQEVPHLHFHLLGGEKLGKLV
ncbi:MAG: histidine triad (HIT) family protein [Alphaproteobacteria bacterium]|jgi:histidine triad (HIT) family protein